jgi:hypothetical protein
MQAVASSRSAVPDTDVLVALDAATDPHRCGHKAAALAQLIRLGFDVPDGFVIPVGTTRNAYALEKTAFAVRIVVQVGLTLVFFFIGKALFLKNRLARH